MITPRPLVRAVMTAAYRLRRAMEWALGRAGDGVHAMALTPAGRLVLVRLSYAPGWRFPGGGRKRREDPVEAILRELREEIGLTGYSSLERIDGSATFLVRGVEYRPTRTWEVEEVREFALERLPNDMSDRARSVAEAFLTGGGRESSP